MKIQGKYHMHEKKAKSHNFIHIRNVRNRILVSHPMEIALTNATN